MPALQRRTCGALRDASLTTAVDAGLWHLATVAFIQTGDATTPTAPVRTQLMPYSDDQLLPISALEHLLYCPRQCALIHIERVWAENALTVQGTLAHDRAHQPGLESRRDLRVSRALSLRSARLGLAGVADVVEWHRQQSDGDGGVALPGTAGRWLPWPVEYKRGRLRSERSFEVQLCAQALCLEEMLGVPVPAGALYGGASHQRCEVHFDAALRSETATAAAELHAMIAVGQTPPAVWSPKCRACSLLELCLPRLAVSGSARRYLDHALRNDPGTENSAP